MIETLQAAIAALNTLTPLAITGACVLIIYQLVAKKGNVRKMADNHLTHIGADMAEMKGTMLEIRNGINILVDRSR